ncbi:MAG: 4Fe-4S binding protein, partial [Clostridiales bacterium]|nr:4Fe-4S binding protein [Clostridiales bacterium]MDE7108139.1 4Fe-4S binding protein [Clostridiales bacterium]
NAISEGDGKYVVDADVCIDCGACEGECPTGAITE